MKLTVFQVLHLPPRETGSPTGREFAASVSALPRDAREEMIFQQITAGNVPAFMRNLVPMNVTAAVGPVSHELVYYVIPDYLAIGSDEDYVLTPMTPLLAQRIADTTRCSLPTKKMVDDIGAALRKEGGARNEFPSSGVQVTAHALRLYDRRLGGYRLRPDEHIHDRPAKQLF